MNCMRLSLMKAAHAALDGAAYRKSGVSRWFFGEMWAIIRTRISYHAAHPCPRLRFFLKENRMEFVNVTNDDRKFGGAKCGSTQAFSLKRICSLGAQRGICRRAAGHPCPSVRRPDVLR